MCRRLAVFIVLLAALLAAPAHAGKYPRVVFPAGHVLAADATGGITVNVTLLQIELSPGLILSAPRGARFSVAAASGALSDVELQIASGALTILNLQTNAVVLAPPGRYRFTAAAFVQAVRAVSDAATGSDQPAFAAEAMSSGYRLADAILVQQQKYLDSLKIDVRDINSALASIIRSLVPRRP